jgi:hypothetical protein
MATKSKLTTEADAILFKFRMYGADCGIYILEDLDMPVKVFIQTMRALLHSGYLKKVHDRLPGMWFQLTKKGLKYVLDNYPFLPSHEEVDDYPFLRHYSGSPCHQPYSE